MIFTRTQSGIKNYPKFYNADIIIYIEGRKDDEVKSGNLIPDKIFYEILASNIFKDKTVEIKCVGNKDAALGYVQPILDSGSKNSIVIIDRDYDGLHCSIVENGALIYTNGYSWENDFWTLNLATALLKDMTLQNPMAENTLVQDYSQLVKRLKIISIFDAAAQIQSATILPKNAGSCGISINNKTPAAIPYSEIKRLIKKFKLVCDDNCKVIQALIKKAKTLEPAKLIQGHLWFHLVYKLVSSIYFSFMGNQAPSKAFFQTLALNKFLSDPFQYMGQVTYDYYSNELEGKLI